MVEATPAAPVLESLRARQPEESSAAAGELGDDERAALTTDGSVAVPEATAGTAGSLGAEAGVVGDAPEFEAVKSVVPEGQTTLPEVSQGMVRPTVRP